MKQVLFFTLALFISLVATAQVDSNTLKVSLSLQVRDWVYLNTLTANNDYTERLHDSLKVRMQSATVPTATTVIKIDSVSVGSLLQISRQLRSAPYGVSVFVFTRINNAIKAAGNTYLQNTVQAMDDDAQAAYNNILKGELDRIKRVQ